MWSKAIAEVLYPKLDRFASEPDFKADGPDDDEPDDFDRDREVSSVMSSLEETSKRSFSEDYIDRLSGTTAKRVERHTASEARRLGIPLADSDPKLGKIISGWRKDTVARFKGTTTEQLAKVDKILREGVTMRPETLAKRISEQVEDIPQSRAEFVARDSVLTLNSQITTQRHKDAGIEKFIWTTSNDERVRDSHEEIDGEVFSYDEPPIVDGEPALPGEPYLCRCVAMPVLPELEDE